MEDTAWVDFGTMESFMKDVLMACGVPEEDANVTAEVLITADKRGIDSHGINRLKPMYYDTIKAGTLDPKARAEIVREGSTTAVIDAKNGLGHPVSKKAMEIAIEKAKKYGMGMVAVRNSNHYGIAGYYSMMAAEKGMIGICGTNARPTVAPTFGIENMMGTNPLAFAFPTDEEFPFVFDAATSIIQRGKVEVYAREGGKVPEGLVVGADGKPLTDASRILQDLASGKAALCPLGGMLEETGSHKGYGYAAVVEILSSALQGGGFLKMLSGVDGSGRKVPCGLGHFFMAIDVSAFTDSGFFRKTTGDILRSLRASRKAPGRERIYTAGEKEHLAWLGRKDKGVPLNRSLQKEILQMRDELGLKGYDFPF
jgi:L-2-hydroxycarboxylate dehydrogenase (NAD+)